jgi:hypothetical protein
MRYLGSLCVAVLLSPATGLLGQASPAASMSPFASAVDAEITTQEKLFVDEAEAMPADKFDFAPEHLDLPGSEYVGVRSFGAQVKHVAADNFAIWAPLTGKPEPAGLNAPNGPTGMTSRDEILRFLKDSFVYSHDAARGLTSENALEMVEFRGSIVTRLSLVVLALTHISTHYGHMAEYLRMCGVVPPASRPMQMPAAPKSSGQ